ncbi:hypothetical protein BG005_011127 [Podila minutissima]|nr:hypothetical protein BG005_011127 [Podila minutissima]
MAAPQDKQRTHNSAKEDPGAMSGVNPRATTFDPQNRQEQEEEVIGTMEDTQQVLQEEWGRDNLKRLLEIQGAFPLAAPAAPPGSGLADVISSEICHHQDHTSTITTTTDSNKGKERAETTADTTDDPKDSTHDDHTTAMEDTLPKPKRKYTKLTKAEYDTEVGTETSEPARKRRTQTRASTVQGNSKHTGKKTGEADMEVDAAGETSKPKPIRKKQSGAASTSKGKRKATTNNEDDMDIMEAGRAATSKATPTQTGTTSGRARETVKETTKGKAKGRKDKITKADAVDEEGPEPVETRKKRTKVSTSECKGKGKATTQEADDDMGDEIEGGAVTAKGKRKRGVISKGGSIEEVEGAEAEGPMLASVETSHRTVSKRKDKARAKDDDEDANEHARVPINPSDPCSLFPTELWHAVLDHLPLSQIARTSSVNNGWLTGARSYRGWAIAAAYGKMGVPKIKYKTFMALVCSRSYFVCDLCLSYSTGKELRSRIPLAVQVNGDAANTWMLCHDCRREYYRRRPKWLRPPCNSKDKTTYVANKKICKTDAMWDYWLDGSDLAGLQYNVYENPYSARGYPMCLFDERVIQKRAHNVHAGWVGLDGAKANVPKSRRAAFKLREESNKIRRMPKKEKKPKPTKTPEVPTLDQHGDDGRMCESVWGDFFDDNYGEGPSNQFGN